MIRAQIRALPVLSAYVLTCAVVTLVVLASTTLSVGMTNLGGPSNGMFGFLFLLVSLTGLPFLLGRVLMRLIQVETLWVASLFGALGGVFGLACFWDPLVVLLPTVAAPVFVAGGCAGVLYWVLEGRLIPIMKGSLFA